GRPPRSASRRRSADLPPPSAVRARPPSGGGPGAGDRDHAFAPRKERRLATSTTKAPAGEEPPGPPPGKGGESTPRRRGALLHLLDVKGAPYAFVAPFFVVFAAFSFYPLVYTSWISLHQVELATLDVMEWAGVASYDATWCYVWYWNS